MYYTFRILVYFFALCFLSGNTEYVSQGHAFPADFEFGAASAAYQVEGGWNEGGKGWSIWDHMVRTRPQAINNEANGDVAANSYHLYKRDVEMLKELGVDTYRLSISWPRVMPYGRDYVNPEGIAYYNALIDELLANGITPYVTIYHWDMPQNLNELGGWLNEDIVDWFGDYARVVYQYFGDRVKHWLTINEPYVHCYLGYGVGYHAPMISDPGIGYYECGRNVLLAHARAYHIYDDEFRSLQHGTVSIAISIDWGLQNSDSEEDIQALQDFRAFHVDYYIHPILSETGNYPQRAIDRVAEASAQQGLSESRLRPFTQEQIEYMKGTMDFFALNHYSTSYIYRNESLYGTFISPSLDEDTNIGQFKDESWNYHAFTTEYAPGLYYLLLYLRDTYNNPTIYITENGCTSTESDLIDEGRIEYLRNYMQAVADAVAEGVNVKGYIAWSLMDLFEWAFGYSIRMGLYAVDMEDENRTRTPRKSALVYKEIVRSKVIDFSYNPDPYAIEEQETEGDLPDQTDGVSSFYVSALIVLTLAIANTFIW